MSVPKPHSEHLAAFQAWALAEKASPYAEWRIDRAQARYLFEQLQSVPKLSICAYCGVAFEWDEKGDSCPGCRRANDLQEQLEVVQASNAAAATLAGEFSVRAVKAEEQFESLHAAALALLESADDQTHPDDGFPIEEWLNLVDAVRGSNPAKERQ